eukprot:m.334442 g.334442  ORF g.334442 m.334442 type:complete len:787 (-) comp20506_c0_seq3:255-2615(-)
MAEAGMETEYDAVLLGTSLELSILAAALSRIGKRVLHLDSNDFYGGSHGTFSLDETRKFSEIFGATRGVEENDPATTTALSTTIDSSSKKLLHARYMYSIRVVDAEEQIQVPMLPAVDDSVKPKPSNKNHVLCPESDSTDTPVSNERNEQEQPTQKDNETGSGLIGTTSVECAESNVPVAVDDQSTSNTSADQTNPSMQDIATTGVCDGTKSEHDHTKSSVSKINLSWEDILKQSRRYCIDVVPKVCLSRGSLVQLLISSNIGRYVEFKAVEETQILMADGVREVPCSKQTLLLNRHIKLGEKRKLMKFLQFCSTIANNDDPTHESENAGGDTSNAADVTSPATSGQLGNDNGKEAFSEYLSREWKFSADIAGYVMYAIANVSSTCETRVALDAVRLYFSSLGQYGKTPFINPMYGSAEIPQAFCRLSAVFGGVYMLRQKVASFVVADAEKNPGDGSETPSIPHGDGVGFSSVIKGVVLAGTGDTITTPLVVSTAECMPDIDGASATTATTCCERLARAVVIVDGPLLPGIGNPEEGVSGLCVPPNTHGNPHTVQVLLLGESSAACPRAKRVVHLTSLSTEDTARHDLEGVVAHITGRDGASSTQPTGVVWEGYFTCEAYDLAPTYPRQQLPSGLVLARPTSLRDMHFESCVMEARRLYNVICPGQEFLPPAPEPEDIVWGADDDEMAADPLTALEQSTQALATEIHNNVSARVTSVVDRIDALTVTSDATQGSRHGANDVDTRLRRLEVTAKRHAATIGKLQARLTHVRQRVNAYAPPGTTESTA